ncbi:ComEA family DNA-binding protein [Rhodocaloribacter sp.]
MRRAISPLARLAGTVRRRSLPRLLALLALLMLTAPSFAQVGPDTTTVERDVENALEDLDVENGDPTQLVERLTYLAENPLDINAATAEELAQIPVISLPLAQKIVHFREEFGLFGSIPELRSIEGMTDEVYARARPYLTIGETFDPTAPSPPRYPPPPSFREILGGLRYEVIERLTRRLDLGRGFSDDTSRTTYLGSPERLYTRLRARFRRRFSLNLTLEKDPGEAFRWDPETQTYGYDYVSAHVALADFGRIKTLVVGDFDASFGQGVVLWRSFATGKSREAVRPVTRFGSGIRPYGSTEENRFFRGLAATVMLTPRLALSGFASRRALDASVLEPDTTALEPGERVGVATTFSTSGLHRTATELARKDALTETLVGGDVNLSTGFARIGVVGYHATFDRPVRPGDAPFRRFDFSGKRATMIGVYGHAPLGFATLFGEAARAPGNVFGGIGGVTAQLSSEAEAVVLFRTFPKDFAGLHGFAFGERNGATQNETGVYVGFRLRPDRRWLVSGYFDQYRFPWLRFGVPRPTVGHEALLVVEHRPRRWITVYLQARTETKEAGVKLLDAGGRLLDGVRPRTRQSFRLHGDYQFSRTLRFRARIEVVRFFDAGEPDEYGVLVYQDVRWRPRPWLQFDARLALFDTDSFDARVFAYENDLLYTFAVPSFSGRGQRTYVLAKVAPDENLTLQIKLAATRFEDVETVSSGLDETDGNRLRELRIQIRWKF